MTIRAGQLRRRVTIQQPTRTNTDGRISKTWANVATVWAQFTDTRGREFMAARQVNSQLTHIIRIRYRSDVKPTWRVLHGSTILNIVSATDPNQRRVETILECIEEVTV